ncbi:MAG: acetate kinase [Bacteroidetes bacterium]|uniref:Acetate kinase n=1 Tax=Candidatus Enterocola intestinipullorum TaxID=2840783 RepID=A0A9D9EFV4_9BACT|nr:acetate kinase [Candidatus Enterocola intestinipullorum]
MKVLVLNCGSSSVKYKLFDMKTGSVSAQGGVERLGLRDSFLKITQPDGEKIVLEQYLPTHHDAIAFILDTMTKGKYATLSSLDRIKAVGHRIVHGGENFNKSVIIDERVIKGIEDCVEMAPLHNPANLEGIDTIKKLLPNVPQVAVFDTAFHQTMPEYAYMYGIPYNMYEKYKIRRYGFHGTSHRYVSQQVCEKLGIKPQGKKIITCHLGNGGSITAIKDGKSIDTSMGYTPLEGLIMGTRSGSIDPGVLTHLIEKENFSAHDLAVLLNKKSGVAGVSGISQDMRDLEAAAKEGNKRAKLALDMYVYSIVKHIGQYMAVLGGADIIVFTGGVGENQSNIRKNICDYFKYAGIEIDGEKNKVRGEFAVISTDKSKTIVAVVPTDEEYMIALDTLALLQR